jgi:hypothetical protein
MEPNAYLEKNLFDRTKIARVLPSGVARGRGGGGGRWIETIVYSFNTYYVV